MELAAGPGPDPNDDRVSAKTGNLVLSLVCRAGLGCHLAVAHQQLNPSSETASNSLPLLSLSLSILKLFFF